MGLHVQAGPRGAPHALQPPVGPLSPCSLPPPAPASLSRLRPSLQCRLETASSRKPSWLPRAAAPPSCRTCPQRPSRRGRRHVRRRPRVRETRLLWAHLRPLGPEVPWAEGRKEGREGRKEGGAIGLGAARSPPGPQPVMRLSRPWAAWPQKRQWAPRKEMPAPLQGPPEAGGLAGGH